MALCCVYSGFLCPVLWPPALAAASDPGGARSGLVPGRAAEERSPQGAARGTDPRALRAVTGVSCRRGSPLLIGVRSEHKLSTDHIPILYRTGECERPPAPWFLTFQPHSDQRTGRGFHKQLRVLEMDELFEASIRT